MVKLTMSNPMTRRRMVTLMVAASMISIVSVCYTKVVLLPGDASGRMEDAFLKSRGCLVSYSMEDKPKYIQGHHVKREMNQEAETRGRMINKIHESFRGAASRLESTIDVDNNENVVFENGPGTSSGCYEDMLSSQKFISVLNSFNVPGHRNFASLNVKRLAYIKKRCRDREIARGKSRKTILAWMVVPHLLNTCVAPKGGSSSWNNLKGKLKALHFAKDERTHILSVRHPLSRLTSAYRDKFLNGAPISAYDSAWKKATESHQTWRQRWNAYWLPALISRGDIKHSKNIPKRQIVLKKSSSVCKRTLRSNRELVYLMERDFQDKMQWFIQHHNNATFSFRDFLKHVLWTHDLGMMDHHWAPQTCLCDPCGQSYDYVLHVENIGHEVRHVLDDLGVPESVHIGSNHNTKKVLNVSDADYFEGIERSLMEKIYRLYWDDFELFGYKT